MLIRKEEVITLGFLKRLCLLVYSEGTNRFFFRLSVRVFRMVEACLDIMESVTCFGFANAAHQIRICLYRKEEERAKGGLGARL